MNVLNWAKTQLAPMIDTPMTTAECSRVLRREFKPHWFQDDGFLLWLYNALARDANRSLKKPSIKNAGESVGTFKPVQALLIDDYRFILDSCAKSKGRLYESKCFSDGTAYHAKGVRFLSNAVENGFLELKDEYPEFS